MAPTSAGATQLAFSHGKAKDKIEKELRKKFPKGIVARKLTMKRLGKSMRGIRKAIKKRNPKLLKKSARD